jgi:hypothetical protein
MTPRQKTTSKYQVQAEARMRIKAAEGDRFARSFLYGYGMYADDPVGFNKDHLNANFTEDITRVIESVRDNQVTIAISANAVGKSYAAAHIAVWFFKAFDSAEVFCAAAPPIENLQQILWTEIEDITNRNPHLFIKDKIRQDLLIKGQDSKNFIQGLVIPTSGKPEEREAKFSGKHAPNTLFVIDEADAVPAEVFKGIDSCMSGGHARLLIMFNPRANRGYVSNLVKQKRGNIIHLSAFDHPNVVTGEDVIPGAVTRSKTIERINTMTTPLPPGMEETSLTFRVPDFLVGQTAEGPDGIMYPPLPAGPRRIINNEFCYKVQGVYPPKSEDQLISRTDVDAAISRFKTYVATYGMVPPMAGMLPTCAMDIGDLGGDLNVLAYKYGNWIPPLDVWEGIDPDTAFVKAAEKIKGRHAKVEEFSKIQINIDSTGVGAGGPKKMQGLGLKKANRVMVGEKPNYKPTKKEQEEKIDFYQLRDQLWWMTMVWLRDDPGAMLPDDPDLADELCTPIYWKGEKDGKIRVSSRETMISLLGRSPDRASAIVLLNAPAVGGVWSKAY